MYAFTNKLLLKIEKVWKKSFLISHSQKMYCLVEFGSLNMFKFTLLGNFPLIGRIYSVSGTMVECPPSDHLVVGSNHGRPGHIKDLKTGTRLSEQRKQGAFGSPTTTVDQLNLLTYYSTISTQNFSYSLFFNILFYYRSDLIYKCLQNWYMPQVVRNLRANWSTDNARKHTSRLTSLLALILNQV